jgi:hypothetical protein
MKLSRELKYLLGALAFSIFVLIIFALFFTSYYFDFFTKFSAAVLGVLLAFLIDRYWESEKKNEDRKDLLRSLRDELERIEKHLGHANLLFPQVWESTKSSGQLRLLDVKQLTELAAIYSNIIGIEYEAKRLRDTKEDFMRTQNDNMKIRWGLDSNIQIEREKELQVRIQKILQDKDLWNCLDEK